MRRRMQKYGRSGSLTRRFIEDVLPGLYLFVTNVIHESTEEVYFRNNYLFKYCENQPVYFYYH